MLSQEENDMLTRVGPGTPAGEMLRRYWHPIAFVKEFKGRPIRRRILGEDLVLFRDDQGRFGLLALRCSHRGTSLEFGHVEDGGLRCCYHGWLYDIRGRVLEMPGEPSDSTFKAHASPGLPSSRARWSCLCLSWARAGASIAALRRAGETRRRAGNAGKDHQLQLPSDDREFSGSAPCEVAAPNRSDSHMGRWRD